MSNNNTAWTFDDKRINVPDVQVPSTDIASLYPKVENYLPLRGHVYTLAVIDNLGNAIGWTLSTVLGYATVKDWMKEHTPEILNRYSM
jgi:hypothetical protein